MDTLKNKSYYSYDYINRYSSVPYYYDTLKDRYVYGIGRQMLKTAPWASHKVQETDTLDSLALKYYNNPIYSWVIAYFNNIQDAFVHLSDYYDILKIPNISAIEFGNER